MIITKFEHYTRRLLVPDEAFAPTRAGTCGEDLEDNGNGECKLPCDRDDWHVRDNKYPFNCVPCGGANEPVCSDGTPLSAKLPACGRNFNIARAAMLLANH